MASQVVDLVPVKPESALAAAVFMPVMSMDVALARRNSIIEFTKKIMAVDQDFGTIPGTGKPSLLKPGAEKLCCFFGLEPEFTELVEDCDWTGDAHKGEPFYYVRYRCRLLRDGRVLGVGEGSCNSWESKYRYRQANRKCPSCGGEFIIQGKEEYGGGWLCFKRKGGCGAKFRIEDPAIAGQTVGRISNPDTADVVNTIQKMAQKRALVAATLIATSASEFFTQDAEDQNGHEDPIDTGGHPVNTQAAQDHVRDRKLANIPAEAADEKGKPAPAQPSTIRESGESQTAGNATVSVHPEIAALWQRMGGRRDSIVEVLAELRTDLLEVAGHEAGRKEYDEICQRVAGGDPLQRKGFARAVVCELYLRIKAHKALTDAGLPPEPTTQGAPANGAGNGQLFEKGVAYGVD